MNKNLLKYCQELIEAKNVAQDELDKSLLSLLAGGGKN